MFASSDDQRNCDYRDCINLTRGGAAFEKLIDTIAEEHELIDNRRQLDRWTSVR